MKIALVLSIFAMAFAVISAVPVSEDAIVKESENIVAEGQNIVNDLSDKYSQQIAEGNVDVAAFEKDAKDAVEQIQNKETEFKEKEKSLGSKIKEKYLQAVYTVDTFVKSSIMFVGLLYKVVTNGLPQINIHG